jgi:hypothetical protein
MSKQYLVTGTTHQNTRVKRRFNRLTRAEDEVNKLKSGTLYDVSRVNGELSTPITRNTVTLIRSNTKVRRTSVLYWFPNSPVVEAMRETYPDESLNNDTFLLWNIDNDVTGPRSKELNTLLLREGYVYGENILVEITW